MTVINESVQSLSARLPELLWKLSTRYSVIHPKLLPRGLFKYQLEMTPQSCIDEIKTDLQVLTDHKHERSAYYLAGVVSQKINVLVHLCQTRTDKRLSGPPPTFGIQSITTRQQWLHTLQEDISRLTTQQQALATTLQKLQLANKDMQAVLSLQAELGEVEQHLTLAKETLIRAMD